MESKVVIELINSESGDWSVLKVNGDVYAEGHSISEDTWLDLLEEVNSNVSTATSTVTDEQMESGEY